MNYQQIKKSNYTLHIFDTNKYKTNTLTIRFLNNLERNNVTKRSLLPSVLKAATTEHKTKKEMSQREEELYDISVKGYHGAFGDCSLIQFSVSVINECYLENAKGLNSEAFKHLKEIILNPLLINNKFDSNIVLEEKRLLENDIEGLEENKSQKAQLNFLNHFYEDKVVVQTFGYLEDLDNINEQSLYDEYLDMLNNDMIDIIYVGEYKECISQLIDEIFNFTDRNNSFDPVNMIDLNLEERELIEEDKELNQAKIFMGYQSKISQRDDLFYAINLYSTILGKTPQSKLFMNVREKESLCYYVSCNFSTFLGTGYVYAGINHKNKDKFISIVKDQFKAMENGDFTEEDLDIAKKVIINSLLESEDSPYQPANRVYSNKFFDRSLDLNVIIDNYNNVTKDSIVECAKYITLTNIYMLKGAN